MKRLLIALLIVLFTSVVADADKYTIDRSSLPQDARDMLDNYFPKTKVAMIKVDKHLFKKTDYDVKLVDGTKIEFSNSGKWTSVDCKGRRVPSDLLPRAMRSYLDKNYKGQFVTEIEKKSSGYEVELSDGIKLKFNLLGSFVKVLDIDD